MSFEEEPLAHSVGNAGAVVRVGDTVRRPAGPHSPFVAAYLTHLEQRGFAGAPRFLGFDERGRETVSYLPGDVLTDDEPPEWACTDEVLVSVIGLVRDLHEAARGFVPPEGAEWGWPAAPEYRGDLVGHNDLCRSNVVFRDGRAAALIDFDWAGPLTPAWEIAGLVGHWVLRVPGDRLRRLALAREAYPVEGLRAAMLRRFDWGMTLFRKKVEAGHPGFVAMWNDGHEAKNAALRAWVAEHVHD
jgi:hypothetical protein